MGMIQIFLMIFKQFDNRTIVPKIGNVITLIIICLPIYNLHMCSYVRMYLRRHRTLPLEIVTN